MKRIVTSLLMMACTVAGVTSLGADSSGEASGKKPNLLFVFADQWRAQATGYAGDPNLQGKTPNLDRLAREGVNLRTAVSTCPVCTPYRGSLMTGQYPLTNGLFVNDVQLNPDAVSLGKIYQQAGYQTGYVGKWHIDGRGRESFIPQERHQGFAYWKVLECTHSYNNSPYYEGDDPTKRFWKGYDAIAQTRDVQQYIRHHANDEKPFCMVLSWGPPHAPYATAPEAYRKQFNPETIVLRPNVPKDTSAWRQVTAGYYAHIAALDTCVGDLLQTLEETGIAEDTIFVFTSDHGDMLFSHDQQKKQQPYDESIRVPLLIRYPRGGVTGRTLDMPFGTPDILPTLLSLSGVDLPATVEGTDYAAVLTGQEPAPEVAALIQCPHPFGQWSRGRAFRGVRTQRYTYVRDLNGPWLLFDNRDDPYQQKNLVTAPGIKALATELDAQLKVLLTQRGDAFLPGMDYIRQWGYPVDKRNTVPYSK